MKKTLILILLFLCPGFLFCETNIFSRITLRKSFQTKNDKAEPAAIAYTNPKDAEASYLINAALGFNLIPNSANIFVYPFIEYHRNTLVEKEQFNYLGGISFEWTLFDLAKRDWSPVLISSAAYNNNRLKKIESLKSSIYLTLVVKNWSSHTFWKTIFVEAFPYIGVENENRRKTVAIDDKGNIYRTFFRFKLTCNPFMAINSIRERIEINLDYQYRHDFITPFKQLSRTHEYFLLDASYIAFQSADKKRRAEIGFEYVNGEDPSIGFEKQSYTAVVLKVKL
jgi:hypothetical protein